MHTIRPTWRPVGIGPITGADWADLLKSGVQIDPYLIWADLTKLAGFDPKHTDCDRWPILVQMADSKDRRLPSGDAAALCKPAAECHPALGMLSIPGVYTRIDAAGLVHRRSEYLTASIAPHCIPELLKCPELVQRFQLGIPRIPQVDASIRKDVIPTDAPGFRIVVGVIDDGFGFAHSMFRDSIGTPRTCFLWDQDNHPRNPRREPWRRVSDEFGYGAELHHDDIDKALKSAEAEPSDSSALSALRFYESIDYVPRQPTPDERNSRRFKPTPGATTAPLGTMLESSHGNSVAALAAGSRLTLPAVHDAQGQWPADQQDFDTSDAWPLVLVQLPTRTSLDSSGGSLGVHILDGLRYIIRRAQAISAPKHRPELGKRQLFEAPENMERLKPEFPLNKIVVNISYGAVAGPHDGTSLLEQAIADLVGKTTKVGFGFNTGYDLRVILAAGNAHGAKTSCRLELFEGGPRKQLTWTVGPDNLLESYLEIWFPDCDITGAPLHETWLTTLQISISPPAGLPACLLTLGEGAYLSDGEAGPPLAAALFARRVVQGMRGTMLLLSTLRTRRPLPAQETGGSESPPVAPHGRWQIELLWGKGVAASTQRAVAVHAWAERNDQLWGHGRQQQSTVESDDPVPSKTEYSPSVREFCRRGEMNRYTDAVPRPYQAELSGSSLSHVPAAGPDFRGTDKASIVGGSRLSDAEMARYSAAGTTRSAPADRGTLPGGDCVAPVRASTGEMDKLYQDTVRNGGPDFDAPSDAGAALRGLRTTGLREGGHTRIGGTSAAAPLVTRHIADFLYRKYVLNKADSDPDQLPRELTSHEEGSGPMDEKSRRTTHTPTRDDRINRGQKRLTPRRR